MYEFSFNQPAFASADTPNLADFVFQGTPHLGIGLLGGALLLSGFEQFMERRTQRNSE
jgi:hypothetical protein